MKTVRFALFLALAIALGWVVHALPVSADARTPRIVAHDSLVGQTADVATISSVTVPVGGADYRVAVMPVLTAGAGNAGQVHIDYTDDLGAQTSVIAINGYTAGTNTVSIHAASGSVIVSTFCTQNACAGSGAHTYNMYAVIEEL